MQKRLVAVGCCCAAAVVFVVGNLLMSNPWHIDRTGTVSWKTHAPWRFLQEGAYSTCGVVPFSRFREDGVLEVHCRGTASYKFGWSGQPTYWHALPDEVLPGMPLGTPPEEQAARLTPPTEPVPRRVRVPPHVTYVYTTCEDPTYGLLTNLHETLQRQPQVVAHAAQNDSQLLPNVLMLWVDAVSRAKFFRRMPLTAALLTSLKQQAAAGQWEGGVYDFIRYGVVGSNSWPNSAALLCNLPPDDRVGKGLSYLQYKKADNSSYVPGRADDPVAQCLWNSLKRDHGYVTAVVRGDCDMRHFQPFFRIPPAWMGPDIDAGDGFCDPTFSVSGRYRCILGKQAHDRTLEYAHQLLDAYNGASAVGAPVQPLPSNGRTGVSGNAGGEQLSRVPSFGVMSILDFHFDTQEVVHHQLDKSFRDSLQRLLFKHGHNTLFVVYSDHGLHFGPYVRGHRTPAEMEHKLPFMYIIAPPSVLKACPALHDILEANRAVITSPVDVYHTLHKLPEFLAACTANGGVPPSDLDPAQFGLLVKLPPQRTCADASIPSLWCEADYTADPVDRIRQYLKDHDSSMNDDIL